MHGELRGKADRRIDGIDRRIRVHRPVGTRRCSCVPIAGWQREPHPILARQHVVEEVRTISTRRLRGHGGPVHVDDSVPVLVDELHGHSGKSGLAHILDAVLIEVDPHHIADGDTEHETSIERRVDVLRGEARVGVDDLTSRHRVPCQGERAALCRRRVGRGSCV